MFVYLIRNVVNEKGYVGQTIRDLQTRFKQHVRLAKKGCKYPLHCAIRKYGEENFEISLLKECCSSNELDEEEIRLIKELNTRENGYNLAEGGAGVRGRGIWHHTDRTKKRISDKHTGKVLSLDVREKIRESVKAGMTPERKSEQRQRTIAALASPERRNKIRKANSKCVQQLTLDGEIVATFTSAKEASLVTGVNHGNLCTCARLQVGHAGGYIWRYVNDSAH